MEKGMVVISKSGRDKGRSFVVVDKRDQYICVADGKVRKIERPKKKNVKHLQKTNKFINIDNITSNKQLYKAILQISNRCDEVI